MDFHQLVVAHFVAHRTLHGLAYNSTDNTLVLFGGRSSDGTQLADTWVFDPNTNIWSELAVSGPAARQAHALVYDPAYDVVVLVGGATDDGDALLNDAWHFENGAWTASDPLPVTSGVAYHKLVYDSNENAITLFTGGETWQYK